MYVLCDLLRKIRYRNKKKSKTNLYNWTQKCCNLIVQRRESNRFILDWNFAAEKILLKPFQIKNKNHTNCPTIKMNKKIFCVSNSHKNQHQMFYFMIFFAFSSPKSKYTFVEEKSWPFSIVWKCVNVFFLFSNFHIGFQSIWMNFIQCGLSHRYQAYIYN